MLTPVFKLSQDDDHVFIKLHAPYTNVAECEIQVDGEHFLFVSTPYFLRLFLPGRIVDNVRARGKYLCETGDFEFKFGKEVPGEHFENLDMITSLLAPRGIPDLNPDLVEEVGEGGVSIQDEEQGKGKSKAKADRFTYGFAGKMTKAFSDIGKEFPQIFELRAPERISVAERHRLRIKYENQKFSVDHYFTDYYEDEFIAPYLAAVAPWSAPDFNDIEFTFSEIDILKDLPNKHYIMTTKEFDEVFLGLVDLLFAYCYDKRSTLFESTVESSWTINKVAATLAWFVTYDDLSEVLVSCYRRALIFPLYRNFALCNKVKEDLQALLGKGKKFVIKCLIDMYNIFNTSCDARYILNQLYVKDYLIFLQACKEEQIQVLTTSITEMEVAKSALGLPLEIVDSAVKFSEKIGADGLLSAIASKFGLMSCTSFDENHFRHDMYDNVKNDDHNDDDDDDEEGWVTVSSASSESSSDDSSDESSEELDSDDDPC